MGKFMNTLTIIVLAIILICGFIGRKAGLVKTVFSMFSMIIALTATVWVSPFIGKTLQNNDKVMVYFSDKVNDVLNLNEMGSKITDQINFIDELPLPRSFKNSLLENNNKEIYATLNVTEFSDYISNSIACVIINAIAFVGTFLVLIIILQVLCFALNIVSKLPILNSMNKAGGLIAGLIHGLIIVWVSCILLTAFGSTSWGQSAFSSINESEILSYIYNHNLITKYATDLTKILLK